MLPVSTALRPFVTDVTFWLAQPYMSTDDQFVLVITVLVWRSTPDYLRRRIRRALRLAIKDAELFDAECEYTHEDHPHCVTPRLVVHVKTDRRDK